MNKTNLLKAASNYRVQRLIRMGEWLEANKDIIVALFDCIDDAHTEAYNNEADDTLDDTLLLEQIIFKQMTPLKGMYQLLCKLRNEGDWGVVRGEPVTMVHPMACDSHKVQEVLPGVDAEEIK